MRLNTTVSGVRFSLTYHCVDRYIERVRAIPEPSDTERERFASELCFLIRKHSTYTLERPDWVPEQAEPKCDGWLVVGRDIAFPVAQRGRSRIVLTCLTRGGFSDERRAMRNRLKSAKRAAKRASRDFESWRGEKNPRWA